MKKFLVLYYAPAAEAMKMMGNATPEQKADGMKPWMEWAATRSCKQRAWKQRNACLKAIRTSCGCLAAAWR